MSHQALTVHVTAGDVDTMKILNPESGKKLKKLFFVLCRSWKY